MALRDRPDGPTRTERVRAAARRLGRALAPGASDHQLDVYTFSDVLSPASALDGVARTPATGDAR
jgi:hypothetical protein